MNEQDIHQQENTQDSNHSESHTVVIPPRGISFFNNTNTEQNKIKDTATAFVVSIALTGFVVSAALFNWSSAEAPTLEKEVTLLTVVTPEQPNGVNPFSNIRLEAQAAVVYDVVSDTYLYSKNAEQVRPLASLTKLMTGLVAYESMDFNSRVVISQRAIETEGDSGLYAQETWRLGDLVSFMLVSSSNDGAESVAAAVGSLWDLEPSTTEEYKRVDVFVREMNKRAKEIGLTNTKFRNPSGLDDSTYEYGGTGTAKDMAILLANIWTHAPVTLIDTALSTSAFISDDGFIHRATNTNKHVQQLSGLLGSKTGYTSQAGGNLAVVYDSGLNHPVVIVVLGSSVDGRFDDVKQLAEATGVYMRDGWYSYEFAGSTKPN